MDISIKVKQSGPDFIVTGYANCTLNNARCGIILSLSLRKSVALQSSPSKIYLINFSWSLYRASSSADGFLTLKSLKKAKITRDHSVHPILMCPSCPSSLMLTVSVKLHSILGSDPFENVYPPPNGFVFPKCARDAVS